MRRLRAGLPVPSFVTDRRPTRFTKPVLIASGALTILGGAVIAPAIPALADIGYELAPLRVRVLEHINDARREAGMDPIGG